MTTADVLVVGAGPVGLATACGLLQQGVAVRVVDAAAGPATTSRANFVHARGSEVLDRLGALGTLTAESLRAMRITTYFGDRPVMRLRFGDPGLRTAAPPMVISQAKVEAALRDRLADLGGKVEWNTPLAGVRQDDDGVEATLGTGETARIGWLVGCDGSGSTTRKLAGIGFPGVKLSERFLLADLRLDWSLDRTGTSGWIHPRGMVGAMPMPDPDPAGANDVWRIIAYNPSPSGEKPSDEEVLQRLKEILPTTTGHTEVRVREALWLSGFTVHRRLADTYRRGRILLAGDAGHMHAPFGGQGMLTGLGDAENLAWKLALVAHGHADDRLLDTYEAERRPLATDVLRGTEQVTKIIIASSPFGRFLRDQVIVRVFSLPWVQRWTTWTTSQLWVSYRRGPLATRGRRKPRPGDRVGDLTCTHDGRETRLHAELRGQWALLVSGSSNGLDTVARDRLGGRLVVLTSSQIAEPFLVRPDGHLAWRGSDAAGLGDWLDKALRTGRVR